MSIVSTKNKRLFLEVGICPKETDEILSTFSVKIDFMRHDGDGGIVWDMFSSSVSRKEKFSPTIFHNNSNQEKKEERKKTNYLSFKS